MSCSRKASSAAIVGAPAARVRSMTSSSSAEPVCERAREALLLGLEQPAHVVAVLDERRDGTRRAARSTRSCRRPQERALEADPRAVLHGPADDPAQDVAAALVRRDDAVGRRASSSRGRGRPARAAPSARRPRSRSARPSSPRRSEMMSRKASVSYTECTPCSSAATRSRPAPVSMFCFGSGVRRAVGAAVVLHEDEVPVLEEAVARAAGRAVRAVAAVLDAAVEVQLGAGAARARRPGGPEVVARRARRCARRACRVASQICARLVVGGHVVAAAVDGRPDPLAIEPPARRARAPRRTRRRLP